MRINFLRKNLFKAPRLGLQSIKIQNKHRIMPSCECVYAKMDSQSYCFGEKRKNCKNQNLQK